jgi:hypothetical protein
MFSCLISLIHYLILEALSHLLMIIVDYGSSLIISMTSLSDMDGASMAMRSTIESKSSTRSLNLIITAKAAFVNLRPFSPPRVAYAGLGLLDSISF